MASGGGHAKLLVECVERQVEREQQAVTEIAHRPAERRNTIALIAAGDIRQVRVVEDDGGPKGKVGQNE